jgi:hypothetical protein
LQGLPSDCRPSGLVSPKIKSVVATPNDAVATKSDIAEVKHAIQLAVRDMTIRMGAIAVALLAALATIKFFA